MFQEALVKFGRLCIQALVEGKFYFTLEEISKNLPESMRSRHPDVIMGFLVKCPASPNMFHRQDCYQVGLVPLFPAVITLTAPTSRRVCHSVDISTGLQHTTGYQHTAFIHRESNIVFMFSPLTPYSLLAFRTHIHHSALHTGTKDAKTEQTCIETPSLYTRPSLSMSLPST
jgi:hypothetical protein